MLKIGVLVSGGGTNFQAIVDSIESGYIENAKIVTLVSSSPKAYALERAKNHNIEGVVIRKKDFENSELYEKALVEHFESREVDLVIMAGFMVVIGPYFINAFRNRIMNIHPSLIPSFCGNGYYGLKVHEAALEKGVKVTGATVHFVTEETDAGPIILQKAVYIDDDDTPESLQKKVMIEAEWKIFPEAIKLFAEGKIEIVGNKVRRK
ncbi:phosphoribosylglycinamide formyltransferase [Tyzzerella sp. An114]|uniref:phosphoribosylglycinamide formyltransferase n=1 Tax=Tyzzerella sp. An114 TaxID=1965545 RepID=UPI000B4532EB|nr:phosphoribosylglycinamide formyltransferase [Tyzzerella sp. An114]OUQ59996.1 phosphoribosylglycinamide formyltransferase [Tyzzerella sp. An114]HIT72502.1 phosphoribosylglycinamide formyltransferase [Candidatus Fimicola cottocaccae]